MVNLVSHSLVAQENIDRMSNEQLITRFHNLLQLHRLRDAWKMATLLQQPPIWDALTTRALDVLDIEMAILVYRQLQNPAMVLALTKIRHIDERNLLAGKVSLLLGDYSRAQVMYPSIPFSLLLTLALSLH